MVSDFFFLDPLLLLNSAFCYYNQQTQQDELVSELAIAVNKPQQGKLVSDLAIAVNKPQQGELFQSLQLQSTNPSKVSQFQSLQLQSTNPSNVNYSFRACNCSQQTPAM
jgi:hypothetical protein